MEKQNQGTIHPMNDSCAMMRSKIKQIAAYLLVGGGTALLELLAFSFLYRLLGLNAAASNIAAVLLATILNFLLNGTITFKGSSNVFRSAILYVLLFLFNTAFSTIIITSFSRIGVVAEAIKILTMICIVVWNYFLYKKVVFK